MGELKLWEVFLGLKVREEWNDQERLSEKREGVFIDSTSDTTTGSTGSTTPEVPLVVSEVTVGENG